MSTLKEKEKIKAMVDEEDEPWKIVWAVIILSKTLLMTSQEFNNSMYSQRNSFKQVGYLLIDILQSIERTESKKCLFILQLKTAAYNIMT